MNQDQANQSIRLKQLIKALHLNQSSFAKSLGMAQPNISRIINGGSNISVEMLNRLAKQFRQVNLHWLLTGVGEMFLEAVPEITPQVKEDQVVYKTERLDGLESRLEQLEAEVAQLVRNLEK